MLGTVAVRSFGRTAFPAARAVSTSPNFGEAWRYDKGAFKTWVTRASTEDGVEKKQLYAHLALSFGDVDNDKDGWISPEEFDLLLEKVAALPRRFGLAPSWQVEYGGDAAKRRAGRKAMFESIDGAHGFKPRGKIAMGQFLDWSREHIFSKVASLTGERGRVAFRHVEDFTKEEYVAYVDEAVNKPDSIASTTLYNYLLTLFVEADVDCKGKISYEQFEGLVEIAAATPRHFGLAPPGRDAAARREMFDAMDYNKSGYVTFRKFVRFVREHARAKVAEYKAQS